MSLYLSLLPRYFTSVPKGRERIAFDAPFEVKGIEKHVIVTATVPADEPYECHQCAPLIGGAVFERVGNQWVMKAEDKYIAVTGEFGTIENDDISLARIASNEYGVLFRGNSVHQGYVSTYVSPESCHTASLWSRHSNFTLKDPAMGHAPMPFESKK